MSQKTINPLPIREEWTLSITRGMCPISIVSTKNGEVITQLNPDSHDPIVGADVLRHLVECHNLRVKELNRKREKQNDT